MENENTPVSTNKKLENSVNSKDFESTTVSCPKDCINESSCAKDNIHKLTNIIQQKEKEATENLNEKVFLNPNRNSNLLK